MKRIIVVTLAHEYPLPVMNEVRDKLSEKLGEDYFVFIMQGIPGQPVKFELFTDQNIPPIELEEIKDKLFPGEKVS